MHICVEVYKHLSLHTSKKKIRCEKVYVRIRKIAILFSADTTTLNTYKFPVLNRTSYRCCYVSLGKWYRKYSTTKKNSFCVVGKQANEAFGMPTENRMLCLYSFLPLLIPARNGETEALELQEFNWVTSSRRRNQRFCSFRFTVWQHKQKNCQFFVVVLQVLSDPVVYFHFALYSRTICPALLTTFIWYSKQTDVETETTAEYTKRKIVFRAWQQNAWKSWKKPR